MSSLDFNLQFFLKIDDLLLTFPVNPEELEVSKSVNYETYANLNKQTILKLMAENLLEIEFESIIETNVTNMSVSPNVFAPKNYIKYFEMLMLSRKQVRLTSSDGLIDMGCFITTVQNNYSVENGGDYGFMLTLTQNRDIILAANVDNDYAKINEEYIILGDRPKTNPTTATQNTTSSSNQTTPNTTTASAAKGQSYTVKSGDTLSSIARKFYNNSNKWTVIYDANKKAVGGNPNLIKVGQVLKIPEVK